MRERLWNRPAQPAVVDDEPCDAPSDDVRRDAASRRLDFGQFGHRVAGDRGCGRDRDRSRRVASRRRRLVWRAVQYNLPSIVRRASAAGGSRRVRMTFRTHTQSSLRWPPRFSRDRPSRKPSPAPADAARRPRPRRSRSRRRRARAGHLLPDPARRRRAAARRAGAGRARVPRRGARDRRCRRSRDARPKSRWRRASARSPSRPRSSGWSSIPRPSDRSRSSRRSRPARPAGSPEEGSESELRTRLERFLADAALSGGGVGEPFLQLNRVFAQQSDKVSVFRLIVELAKPYPTSAEAHFAIGLAGAQHRPRPMRRSPRNRWRPSIARWRSSPTGIAPSC